MVAVWVLAVAPVFLLAQEEIVAELLPLIPTAEQVVVVLVV
jgi:hypothetical protein